MRSGVCQHRSHWRLVCPPSRPPCHCGQTASWPESSPLGSKGAGEGGLRGDFRLLNAVIPLHTSRRAAIQSLPATPSAISSWMPVEARGGPGQLCGLDQGEGDSCQVQGSPLAWRWGGWLSENQTRSPVSWLVLIRGTQTPTMLLAPALAHPWAQLAHAGPPTPVLDSAGGTGEAYPGAAYLPVTDIAFFF